MAMIETVNSSVAGFAAAGPAFAGANQSGVKLLVAQASVADGAKALPDQLKRRSVVEAIDRKRNEQLKLLAEQKSKQSAVEPTHALNALLNQVSRGQFENLPQLKTHLDSIAVDAKRQMVEELDQSLHQLQQQDDTAIKLGMRLSRMFAQVEAGGDATLKSVESTHATASVNVHNIREFFEYLKVKYKDMPLDKACLCEIKSYSAGRGSLNNGRDQPARAADNAQFVFALAGMVMARLCLGLVKSATALFDGGLNSGTRFF